MQKELGMNAINNAYTIVSLVFFFPYALFQPPATVAIREFGPRNFLTFIVFSWGVVTIVSHIPSQSPPLVPFADEPSRSRASVSSIPGS